MRKHLYEEICRRLTESNDLDAVIGAYDPALAASIDGIYRRLAQSTARARISRFQALNVDPSALLATFTERAAARPTDDAIICGMALEQGGVPPCYLARILIRSYVGTLIRSDSSGDGAAATSCDMDALDDDMDSRAALRMTAVPTQSKHSLKKLFHTPSLIASNEALARCIARCHVEDEHCSPRMDEIRSRVGREYEERLTALLDALGVPYMDELGMRRMGYARTPDAVLLEPIAVDGVVIKWIESKAWFGDPPSHATYLADQYWPYYNRFGPGLVIYWFGFVDESVAGHHGKGVAVMDAFPDASRITRITPVLPDTADGLREAGGAADV